MQSESDHPHNRPLLALGLRLAAALVLAGLLACVKLASERGIHLAEIMFWRQLPTIPILLGWFALRRQLGTLKTARMGSHLRRSGFGMVGMTMNFGAATLLPLAVATTPCRWLYSAWKASPRGRPVSAASFCLTFSCC